MRSLQQTLTNFFSTYSDGRPVLLGLSGGCDSLSLYNLLLQAKIPFQVAHVDHGWREESRFEAETLKTMVEADGIPFHLHRFQSDSFNGNLELYGREERLKFFEKICTENNLQAALTAHHADDQAETVMMRFLSQAPLERFSGIQPVSKRGQLSLWRPLLTHPRTELETFLLQQQKSYFEDVSNKDEKRMRASLRHRLIPTMSQMTGRDFTQSLISLQEQVNEMKAFFDMMTASYLSNVEKGPFGWKWKVDAALLNQTAPLKFALRSFLSQAQFPYHRQIADDIVVALQKKAANRYFCAGGKQVYVDRSILMVSEDYQVFKEFTWSIASEKTETQKNAISCSWEDLWKGDFHAFLPIDNVKFIPSDPQALYPGHQPIRLWWNKHKIPACMRRFAPLLVNDEGKVVHEFLTGKVMIKAGEHGTWMKFSLS